MNKRQRFNQLLIGFFMILLSLILFLVPEDGLIIVAVVLSVSLLAYSVRMLFYYFSMARHMVGGRIALYAGVIVLDFAMFLLSITDIPKIYIALYLLVIYAFTGAIDVLRGMEAKKMQAPLWRMKVISGAVNIIIAVLCIALLRSTAMIVYLYCIGLLYSAFMRIASAFKRTSVVYIA